MMIFNYIEVQQPVGVFYICSIPAQQLMKIVNSRAYSKTNDGVQRDLSPERTNAIARYCSDPDAVFPTPIVVSVDKEAAVDINETDHTIIIKKDDEIIGQVIDGQHRLWGISKSDYATRFNLPVVFMFDLTIEEKAYVFATINSNQKKVDTSLIYQLFDVSEIRTPQRTAHQLARVMNYNENSPFYNRLKMLGKKTSTQEYATLSQGTFAKSMLMLISRNYDDDALKVRRGEQLEPISGYLFRDFFIADKDDMMVQVLLNCFNALKNVFPDEWNTPNDNILWKTTGFRAVIYSLKTIFNKGRRERDLTTQFFVKCFSEFKNTLIKKNLKLTSESFPGGGEQNQKKLANLILDSVINIDKEDYMSHLKRARDYQCFIDDSDELDNDDLYDLAQILLTGKSVSDRFKVGHNEESGEMEIIYPFTEAFIALTDANAKEFLNYLKNKYMNDMDVESWYGYIHAMEKDD